MPVSNLMRQENESGRAMIIRLLAVFLVVLFVGATFVYVSAETGKIQPAKVLKARGDVSVLTPGSAAWRQVNDRERLQPGTRLKTGKGATLLLELSARNYVHVGENAEFNYDAAIVKRQAAPGLPLIFSSNNTFDFKVDQPRGRVTAILRGMGPNSQFEHRTPVSVAGVRGTVYACNVRAKSSGVLPGSKGDDGDLAADWAVFEGNIGVTDIGGGPPVDVGAGEFFTVEGGGGPTTEGGPTGEAPGGPAPMTEEMSSELGQLVNEQQAAAAENESSASDPNVVEQNDIGADVTSTTGCTSSCY